MINGSCLCGLVTYQITGDIGPVVHCHCVTCRKAHGAAFSSVSAVKDVDFKLTGENNITSFESSQGKKRYFCSTCGTQLFAKRDGTEHIILRMGSLDDDPNTKEQNHIWVSQRAPWYSINNQLPEHDEFDPCP